jgi:hypothetical protein
MLHRVHVYQALAYSNRRIVNVFTTNRAQQTSMFKKKPMPLINKEIWLDHGYGMDLLVDNKLVVEIKTVEVLTDRC